jgi:hypothetical protein
MTPTFLLEIDLETLRPVALILRLASGRTVRAPLDEASAAAMREELALSPRAEAALARAAKAPRALTTEHEERDEVPSL